MVETYGAPAASAAGGRVRGKVSILKGDNGTRPITVHPFFSFTQMGYVEA